MWWEVIVDALLDTLKLFPFLFLLYILIELMENGIHMARLTRLLSGKAAPVIGAATGLLPMCGFSVMAARLYSRRHLTLGALLAVFVATSDEGFIVLLFSDTPPDIKFWSILALLGSKFVLGVTVGYLADLLITRRASATPLPPSKGGGIHGELQGGGVHGELQGGGESSHTEEAHTTDSHTEEDAHGEDCEEGCSHRKKSKFSRYFLSPLLHAFEVAGFVLLVNLLFGFLFWGLGRGNAEAGNELVASFMRGAGFWAQPLFCAVVGLIPNCASSVILAEVYALGGIGFGGLLGGLVVNTGLGVLALIRGKGSLKETVLIVITLFILGIGVGYAAGALSLLF